MGRTLLSLILFLTTAAFGEKDAAPQHDDTLTLEDVVLQLQSAIEEINQQKRHIEKQDRNIEEHQMHIWSQNERIEKLEDKISTLQPASLYDQNASSPGAHLQTNFACDGETLSISCPDNKTIFVHSAYYGQYIQECAQSCCPPHPGDCRELMEEHAPVDWLALKVACDNRSECEIQNPGRDVLTCSSPYEAHYVQAYYSCLPGDERQISIFTATIEEYDRNYDSGDVIIFDIIITNIGSDYDTRSGTYTCPYDGIYVFSLSIMNIGGAVLAAQIMHENNVTATAYCDPDQDSHSTNTVAFVCNAGERVWVRSHDDGGRMWANEYRRHNTFYGVYAIPYET